jgi:predicted transposase YbfD/YdcC
LVSLVRHDSGIVLNQLAVNDKSNEITAMPQLLAKRDLTGAVTTMDALLTKITYAITSLPVNLANAHQLAAIWRFHWTIENKVHYVRDVTFGEDACLVRTGTAPHALAAFRNAVISLSRLKRWRSMSRCHRRLQRFT